MTFTIELDGLEDLLVNFRGVASSGQIASAVSHGIRETMKQYQNRLNRLTRTWKTENVPYFGSPNNANILQGETIVFPLENTKIWGIVSAGSPRHDIKPVNAKSLSFTGYIPNFEKADPYTGKLASAERSFKLFRIPYETSSRNPSRIDYVGAARRGDSSIPPRPKVRQIQGQFNRALALVKKRDHRLKYYDFPPTYIASTNPTGFTAIKARHIGEAGPGLGQPRAKKNIAVQLVDHPGMEPRNLSDKLINGRGQTGGDLNVFFGQQVSDMLNRLVQSDSNESEITESQKAFVGAFAFGQARQAPAFVRVKLAEEAIKDIANKKAQDEGRKIISEIRKNSR